MIRKSRLAVRRVCYCQESTDVPGIAAHTLQFFGCDVAKSNDNVLPHGIRLLRASEIVARAEIHALKIWMNTTVSQTGETAVSGLSPSCNC